MKSFMTVSLVVALALAVGVFVGCSGSETEEAATAAKGTVDKAKEVAATADEKAVDLASFDNPKKGVCPVCVMNVEAAYVETAEIEDKKYACCSASCVAKLTETPDKYLAHEHDPHEGHNH